MDRVSIKFPKAQLGKEMAPFLRLKKKKKPHKVYISGTAVSKGGIHEEQQAVKHEDLTNVHS